jgi:hypothetical protein
MTGNHGEPGRPVSSHKKDGSPVGDQDGHKSKRLETKRETTTNASQEKMEAQSVIHHQGEEPISTETVKRIPTVRSCYQAMGT